MPWKVEAHLHGITSHKKVCECETMEEAKAKIQEIVNNGFYLETTTPKSIIFYPANLIKIVEAIEFVKRNN